MKIKTQVLISYIIIICMSFSLCNMTVLADNNSNDIEAIFNLGFDDDKAVKPFGYTDMNQNNASYEENGDGYALRHGLGRYLLKFDEGISTGKYVLTFDCMTSREETYSLIRLISYDCGDRAGGYDAQKLYEAMSVSNVDMAYWKLINGTKHWTSKSLCTTEPEQWTNVSMCFDFDTLEIEYFIDGKHAVTDIIHSNMKELWGIDYSVERGSVLIDNLMFFEATGPNVSAMTDKGYTFPDAFSMPVNTIIKTDSFGFNYLDNKLVSFKLSMENQYKEDKEYDFNFKVTDKLGMVVLETDRSYLFSAGERKEDVISFNPEKYGILKLTVTATDRKTGRCGFVEQDFSYSKAAEVKNTIAGIDSQSFGGCTPEIATDIMKLYNDIGFSANRYCYNWGSFGVDKGTYDLNEIGGAVYQNVEKFMWDNGWTASHLFTASNLNYEKSWWSFPKGERSLNAFESYCYNVAKHIGQGSCGSRYEVWNEPNALGHFNADSDPTSVYVDMLKHAYSGIKRGDPTGKVLAPATSGYAFDYHEEILKLGGGEYMDGVAVHPYMWTSSPEVMNLVENTTKLKDLYKQYGYDDMEVYYTEVGYYDAIGQEKQTNYTLRMFLLTHFYDLAENILMFRAFKDTNSSQHFGMLNAQDEKNPLLAHDGFPALAYYNATFAEAEPYRDLEYDDSLQLKWFKLRDGSDAIAYWTKYDNEEMTVSLDLGTESVILSDIYGNETEIHGIDGKYSFEATDMPRYIIGNFEKAEKSEELFSFDSYNMPIVANDAAYITFNKNVPGEFNFEIKTSEKLSADNAVHSVDKDTTDILINSGNIEKTVVNYEGNFLTLGSANSVEVTTDGLDVLVKKGDDLYFKAQIEAECMEAVDVEYFVQHDSGERWKYVVKTKNNSLTRDLSGIINIIAPEEFSKYIKTWDIGKLKAGESKTTYIPIPDLMKRDDLNFAANLDMSDGTAYDLSGNISFLGFAKMKIPPKIDGVLSPGEWNEGYKIRIDDTTVTPTDNTQSKWTGKEDSSADVYLGFDDTHFYFASRVTDDLFFEDTTGRGAWNGDGFQFVIAEEKILGAKYSEFYFGLKDGKPSLTRTSQLVPKDDGSPFANELEIKRDGKYTYYEFAVPFSEVYGTGYKVKNANSMVITILLNDRDTKESQSREHMLEYGGGVASGTKNPGAFAEFNLIK